MSETSYKQLVLAVNSFPLVFIFIGGVDEPQEVIIQKAYDKYRDMLNIVLRHHCVEAKQKVYQLPQKLPKDVVINEKMEDKLFVSISSTIPIDQKVLRKAYSTLALQLARYQTDKTLD